MNANYAAETKKSDWNVQEFKDIVENNCGQNIKFHYHFYDMRVNNTHTGSVTTRKKEYLNYTKCYRLI